MSQVESRIVDALADFSKVAREELHRVPLSLPEEIETMSWREVSFIRWGLGILERDPTFHKLVRVADEGLLGEHRAVMGEGRQPRGPDGVEAPVEVASLGQHIRCFLRRSGAYTIWLREGELDPATLAALLVAQIRRASVAVHTFAWVEGIHRPGRTGLNYAAGTLLAFEGDARKDIVREIRSHRLYFWDGLAFDPSHLEEMELIHLREERAPAAVLGETGEYGPDNLHFTINFAAGREAFPRRSWRGDLEQALDGIRLVYWHPFQQHREVSEYSPPSLRSMLALHDGLLYQPFPAEHARAVQRGSDPGPHGEVEHAAYWIYTSDDDFGSSMAAAGDLGRIRGVVPGDVTQWAFVERAFDYLRKSEDASGYDQFVLLIGAVDCLIGKGKAGAGEHPKLLRRWAHLSASSPGESLDPLIAQLDALYNLRSRFVHGDLGRDAVLGIRELNEVNANARMVLRRFVRWLTVLRETGRPAQMPNKNALIEYLNALDDSAALADVGQRHVGLRSTPELTML